MDKVTNRDPRGESELLHKVPHEIVVSFVGEVIPHDSETQAICPAADGRLLAFTRLTDIENLVWLFAVNHIQAR
ncbi:MAG: hypothetical protein ACRD50_02890 [Candidatus Acidiferrales bacterium]